MYKDHIIINENFQSSVNIDLDLGNEAKIRQYIPTSDICDVLGKYFDGFLGISKNRATTLVGPYGKGKSFLLLVLSYLVSADTNGETYKELCVKIGKIDLELQRKIEKFRSKARLMTVLINSNYQDLNQAFLLGLNDALARNRLDDIVPETTFKECVKCIERWKQSEEFGQKATQRCLNAKEIGVSLNKLERGLGDCSKAYYQKFLLLFSCLTGGMPFNPLVTDDVSKIYSQVLRQLQQHGYKGIFVIFDEFSKFLDGDGENLSKDLKLIQDFAELATRSPSDEQINFCCVTHKSLDLYRKNKSDSIGDAFKTVEGRFKEIRFNRSLEENYQIISVSFSGDDSLHRQQQDFYRRNTEFYNRAEERLGLKTEAEKDALFEGCYPMNPYTVFAIINLSELCAQNERTLFTFISDVDENGFTHFINKEKDGLLNVDKLFDYFSSSLRNDDSGTVRSIWYRTESILSKITDGGERAIIKALAVALIINDFSRLSPRYESLADMLCMKPELCQAKTNSLVESHLLRKSGFNGFLAFASSNSREIDERILTIRQTKLKSVELSAICNEAAEKKYYLPRRYNEENKITRFYRSVFLSENQFFSMDNFDLLHSEAFSDGIVINVLLENKSEKDVKGKINEVEDKRVIARPSQRPIDSIIKEELLQYASLKEIYREEKDSVVSKEIELLLDKSSEDIGNLIKGYYENANAYALGAEAGPDGFVKLLSDVMDSVYTKRVIFNYELVNKNTLTAQYQKSVNQVVEWILNGEEDGYFKSETSPEASIVKSIVKKTHDGPGREVVDGIKNLILETPGVGIKFDDLMSKYCGIENGYGLRKGVMPILIAKAIGELSMKDNILLYYRQQEIDLNAENLAKAVKTEDNYCLRFAKGSKKQIVYLSRLLQLFLASPSGNFRRDIKMVTNVLSKFFAGLPAVLRNDQYNSDFLGCPQGVLKYKNRFYRFNLNPYESVFECAYEDFGTKNLDSIFTEIENFKKNVETYISEFKTDIVGDLKNSLDISHETSLRMDFQSLLKSIPNGASPVLSDRAKRAYEWIKGEKTFDDSELVDDLSHLLIGSFIEDWASNRRQELLDAVSEFYNEVKQAKTIDLSDSNIVPKPQSNSKVEISAIGELLESNLKTTIDEYGESISNEEKAAILLKLLKEVI